QKIARIAGLLVLISIVAGAFAEVYVPGKLLVSSNPIGTADNVARHARLFGASFVFYLVEAVCDVTLVLIFYLLLRPVSYMLSLLAAFFGIVSTATFATAELFYFVSSIPVLDAHVHNYLSQEQRSLFIYSSLTMYAYGGSIFMVFYGIATALRGYLMYGSAYLPKWLGILLMLAGLGFITRNLLIVLSLSSGSMFLAIPMFAAMIALAGWLLFKGIDTNKWPASIAE
ncbi:MAG TPA: DUF4386 domain-containing protein, partial [Acidobacteriaceae bacterium]|nr:DUF4386 domain-containing protein [Acidobacteriaceae bacterium]